MIVFAVVERERDNLIDRDDLRVTQCGRKQPAKFLKARFNSLASLASFAHENRRGERGPAVIPRPLSAHLRDRYFSRLETASGRRFAAQDLQLNASFYAGFRFEHARSD